MQRIPAIFLGDSRALDFLNSKATPVDVPIDWLDDGEGLLGWLLQAELVPTAVLEQMRRQCPPAQLDRLAGEARTLREWFRGFVRRHMGHPLERGHVKELEALNRLLQGDELFHQIAPATSERGAVLEMRALRRWRSPDALLLPLAEVLARFIASEDFRYIKACEGPACTLLFADHTRNRMRRWCSMALCGNRAKQAAHRQRRSRTSAD